MPTRSINAVDLLEKQHRKVEAIFKKLEGGRSEATALVVDLANNLAAHMAIEHELFYPAVVSIDPTLISESFEEHALAEIAIKRLLATDPSSDSFKAHVVATKELIEHHVKEEEEELFPKVSKALGEEKLLELGAQMKARFAEVYAAGYASVVPGGFARTSADLARRRLSFAKTSKAKKAA